MAIGRVSTNGYATARFIVDTNGISTGATHSTIAAALTDAVSGQTIYIRPGTYTENLTLKAGVNLCACDCDSSLNGTGNVIISGNATLTAAGSVTITGIQLQTNSAAFLTVSGTVNSIVNLKNCYLNATNATGISFTTSGASAAINVLDCRGNLGTTAIAVIASTAAGTAQFQSSYFTNTGASATANTTTAGLIELRNCFFKNPFTSSSTGAFNAYHSTIDSIDTNTTSVTANGTGGNNLFYCVLSSGTASAVSVGGSATIAVNASTMLSTNASTVAGAGVCQYSGVVMGTTAGNIAATTTTGNAFNVGVLRSSTHPAFLATKTSAQTDATGDATTVTVGYSTEIYDQRANYDATNTFTAPFTGRYAFTAGLNFAGTLVGHTICGFNFVASNRTLNTNGWMAFNVTPTGATCIINAACEVDMDVNDTMVMAFNVNGSTKVIDLTGGFFAGHLIC